MPVPNSMQDLSQLAGSNSPAGTEAIGNSLDNYMRAHGAIIRSTNAIASASIASATTTDVAVADGESVVITGTTTIGSLGTGFVGCYRELRFAGALTLTHSANLQLPNGASITTQVGDALGFRCIGSGVWSLVNKARTLFSDVVSGLGYTPANLAGAAFTGSVSFSALAFFSGSSIFSGSLATRKADGNWALEVQDAGGTNLGGLYVETNGLQIIANGTSLFQRFHFGDDGNSTFPGGLTLGGGRKIAKVTLSTSAPGALTDGELYFRY